MLQNSIATKITALNKQFVSQSLLNWSQVRYRKAVSFRKYQQPHLKQKLLLSVCEPIQEIDRRLPSEKCSKLKPRPPREHHVYDVLLAKDMTEELENASLVCFFHQNQMNGNDRRCLKNDFEREELFLRFYNRNTAEVCLKNTKFEPLLHFSVGYYFPILFAPDYTKINKIFNITKKSSKIFLIGGMVDKRRLLNIKQLTELSKLPDLDTQRAILCHTLSSAPQSLLSTLNYQSSKLSQLLQSHSGIKDSENSLPESKEES